MPNIGPLELVVVLVVALLILGPKKLPGVGRSVGQGLREFKQSISGRDEGEDREDPVGLMAADAAADRPAREREAA